MPTTKFPGTAFPAFVGLIPTQWQSKTGGLIQPRCKHTRQAPALHGIFEIGFQRIDVDRLVTLLPQVVQGILITGHHVTTVYPYALRQVLRKRLGIFVIVAIVLIVEGN